MDTIHIVNGFEKDHKEKLSYFSSAKILVTILLSDMFYMYM